MSPAKPLVSPCIRVCAVDGAKGLCVGCGRTLKEIAQWTAFTDPQREQIMAALPARIAAARGPGAS